jgi:hypothetical protein
VKPGPNYAIAVDKCDVLDCSALVKYREKRDEWLRFYELKPEEPNSIQHQIFGMLFLDMTYRILAEARRGPANNPNTASSGLLAHLLDQGYVANQILAIRRLLDRRKDVVSVRRLLDDITSHRHLITREIYVCYDGTPYDADAWQTQPQSQETNIFGIMAPEFSKYMSARARHETFDRLSGVSLSNRKRDDQIKESVFSKLNQWLQTSPAKKLITLSHKFFAHAADLDSRGTIVYAGIQLKDIADVHRAIIRVERAITDYLLAVEVGRDVVPIPPLGLLKGLDVPYVSSDAIAGMHDRWSQLADEREKWLKGIADEL